MNETQTLRFRGARLVIGACIIATTGAARTLPIGPAANAAQTAPASLASQAQKLVSDIQDDQQTLQTELQRVELRSQQVRLRTIARGRHYVRLTRAGLLPASSGIDGLLEHAARVERLKRALDRDLQLGRQLADLELRLRKKRSDLQDRLDAMQVERRLMAQNRVALEAAQDRALAFERAFSNSAAPAHTAIYGAGVGPADPTPSVSGFAALKGRLPFPLTGRTEVREAQRRAASGPAMEMLAASGSTVRAVYPGTVAFADEYADYGKSIILDHGDGYFTVSANLASILVEVGEDVGSGAALATVGETSGGATLYFEIRSGTETLNPAEWFGL